MADYYSIMVKAVRALDRNTGDARRRLYDRARAALLAEMRSVDLALALSDIMAAQMCLEEAIGKIEADAGPDEPAQVAIDTPSTTSPRGGVVAAPRPPANQNDEQRRGPLTRLWTRVFRRAGVGALSRGEAPFGHSPDESDYWEGRDPWLTELLARASREVRNDDQDFAPKRELRRNGWRD
jgi:hypothetical protein